MEKVQLRSYITMYCCIQAQMVKAQKDEKEEEKGKEACKGIFVCLDCFNF